MRLRESEVIGRQRRRVQSLVRGAVERESALLRWEGLEPLEAIVVQRRDVGGAGDI